MTFMNSQPETTDTTFTVIDKDDNTLKIEKVDGGYEVTIDASYDMGRKFVMIAGTKAELIAWLDKV